VKSGRCVVCAGDFLVGSNGIEAILGQRAVVLGPMAGITEAPFRGMCRRQGASLTFTEMISAKGLHYNPDSKTSRALLALDSDEVPCAVQIFGSDPDIMAEQTVRILDRLSGDFCLVDINMGCPVAKVVSKKEGCALMRDPGLAFRIASAVVNASTVPVSVKFRSGWDAASINAVDFAMLMQEAGVSVVTVHGRTRSQFYRGKADWDIIARVKAAVDIPVLGSGDVFSAADVLAMFERTGVDGVMVARGAQGNPWVFRESRALLDRGDVLDPPSGIERVDAAREHARALVNLMGDRAVPRMRKHVAWYIHGLPEARKVRDSINAIGSHQALDALLADYRNHLLSGVAD